MCLITRLYHVYSLLLGMSVKTAFLESKLAMLNTDTHPCPFDPATLLLRIYRLLNDLGTVLLVETL